MDKSSGLLQLIRVPICATTLLVLFLGVGETVAQHGDNNSTHQQAESLVKDSPEQRQVAQQLENQDASESSNQTAAPRAQPVISQAPWTPVFQAMISGAAALFGALVGGWVARVNASAANSQRANEVEVNQLRTKLDEFYGKFQLISGENKLIANEFRKRQGEGFRTLLALLDPNWLDKLAQADQAIVKSMVDNGKDLRRLIRESAGLVDIAVHPYLAKVSAHFSILELAYEKKLMGPPENFAQYVYPEKLDKVLELEISRLEKRIALLISESDKRHKVMAPLQIPDHLKL